MDKAEVRLWFLVAARFGEKHLLSFKFQVSSSLKREDSIALKSQDDSHVSVNSLLFARTGFILNKKGTLLERWWASLGTPRAGLQHEAKNQDW